MQFSGNFFIHGWPYYPDGTPVASTFSGGCVRMSTEDAGALYELIPVRTPVLVYDSTAVPDRVAYVRKPNTHTSLVHTARSYLAFDLTAGVIIEGVNTKDAYPIASITKLMTAIIALEQANLDRTLTVPKSAIVYTSRPRYTAGEKVQAYNLLYPLLTESSNEAAHTLAAYFGAERFVALMNDMATSLAMRKTTYVDAAGSGAGNVASAEDLAVLAGYIHAYRKQIFDISASRFGGNSYYGTPSTTDLRNFNYFSTDTAFVGGKSGKTEAAMETMLALFTMEFDGVERTVGFVILGAQNAQEAVRELRTHVQNSYTLQVLP
jgi:D-alanyl-D-alanine carboxypeptidase